MPDGPAENGVDEAAAPLDAGQDQPGDRERPRDLGEPVEHDPVYQGRVLVGAGDGHLRVLDVRCIKMHNENMGLTTSRL